MLEANALPARQRIQLPDLGAPYRLDGDDDASEETWTDLDVEDHLTIEGLGPAPVQIQGAGALGVRDRLLEVHGPIDVRLRNLSLAEGEAARGGAILVDDPGARLVLEAMVLAENSATDRGGAVAFRGRRLESRDSWFADNTADRDGGSLDLGADAFAVLDASTVEASSACNGGGIAVADAARLVLVNSTVSGNDARGCDLPLGGGLYFESELTAGSIYGSTVAFNRAGAAAEELGRGGGAFIGFGNAAADVRVRGSVFAGNEAEFDAPGGPPSGGVCLGEIDSLGFNVFETIDSDGLCSALGGGAAGDVDAAPLLAPLALEGPTPAHPLDAGSPAIDRVDSVACVWNPEGVGAAVALELDQRGFVRPADGDGDGVARCDAGSFERGAEPSFFSDGFETGSFGAWSAVVP